MKSFKKALLFGFFVWLIPFVVAIIIYPIKDCNPPLFESIMPVVISLVAVFFAIVYFKKVDDHFVMEGVQLGIIWFALCIILDLLLFMWGPMEMTFLAYMADIGLTYLMIPVITCGFGKLIAIKIK